MTRTSQVIVDRHQFDGGYAERLEMGDGGRVGETGVSPTLFFRDLRMSVSKALDVRFVDQRLVPGGAQQFVAFPVEARVDDHRLGHQRRAVAFREPQILIRLLPGVAENFLAEAHVAVDGLGVGVDEQFVRIEAVTLLGCEGTVDPKAVTLAGSELRDIAMPDAFIDFREFQPGFMIVGVEEAKFDPRGVFRKQSEIDALTIP